MNVVPTESKTHIQSAIAEASRKTGIDFSYLLGQAQVESGMRTNARASTSSATGLYQFIEQSWLGVMKAHGAEHGLGWAADAIHQNASGRYSVSDPATRRAILDLRTNPQVSSLMAAEHAADNKASLEGSLGRSATGTDLYMAHFLGLGGARNFLASMQSNPQRSGAALFPAAARANRNVFYASNGQPRTLSDIYSRFSGKLDAGAAAGRGGMTADPPRSNPFGDLDPGIEVLLGNGAVDQDRTWVQTTLANLNVVNPTPGRGGQSVASASDLTSALPAQALASLYRPTPETARLAYLMLANLGA